MQSNKCPLHCHYMTVATSMTAEISKNDPDMTNRYATPSLVMYGQLKTPEVYIANMTGKREAGIKTGWSAGALL